MGLISDLRRSKASPGEGTDLWRRAFATHKEERFPERPPVRGGTQGRSVASTYEASFKRLLQAMRSMAPGGWSDDRYEQTRHFQGITYVCVHRKAEQMMQGEFQVYKRDRSHPDGKREVTPDDPPDGDRQCRPWDLVQLLQYPNREDSFGDVMYRWSVQMDLTGTALTWMVPNKLGTPFELYSIPTAMAVPQPAVNPDFPDGYYRLQPVYPYGPFSSYPTPASAVGAPIPAQWMMRFMYAHPLLRYEGFAPQTGLRFHLDEVESMDRSRTNSMRQSFNPSAVLQMKEVDNAEMWTDEQIERIRAEFENELMGPDNHGRLYVAAPGCELAPWGTSPKDMDYQSGWSQLVDFCMAGYGITKLAAGMVNDASYATLFATLKQLHLLTLNPMCQRISSRLTRFLAPFFGDDLVVEVRCGRIDDHELKQQKLNFLMSAKALTKNEARREMDFPTDRKEWDEELAGEGGEEQQQGMPGPGGQAGAPEALAGEGAEGAGQFSPEEDPIAALLAGEEDPDAEAAEESRPLPGPLGRGALGPRKSLDGRVKGFYDLVRETCRNGRALVNGQH